MVEISMAHVLIAATNDHYRRTLAELLGAADHHIATTPDAGLARAALAFNERPMIALLADSDLDEPSMLDVAAFAAPMQRDPDDPGHICILLTNRRRSELSPGVQTLLAIGAAVILPRNCSIAELLTAVDVAAEYLAEHGEAVTWRAPCSIGLGTPCEAV
jgi:CheY-like chemotaxis protein